MWEFDTESSAPAGRILKAHFILKWSKHPDGSPRAKARLITQGFKDPDALNGLVDRTSPTLTRLARHCMLSLAATLGWDVSTGDITTAFLQGKAYDGQRTLWIRLPADARKMLGLSDTKVVMRLLKPIYGLVDAPRAWYREACSRLEALGFRRHPLDQCVFLYYDESKRLVLAVGLYVDDLLCIGDGSSKACCDAKARLKDAFAFREWHEGERSVEYLGSQIERLPDGSTKYHQAKYFAKLHPITVDKARAASPEDPVTEKERTKLRALLGGLQWAATQSAPHVQPHTSMLAGQTSKATVATLLAANKALRFAKANSDVGLCYQYLGPFSDLVLVAYSDASFACRPDLSSQGGYLVTLCHKDALQKGTACAYHVLDWRSFRLPRVARSTLSAEGQAAAEAADALYFTSLFLKAFFEPGLDLASPTAAQLENQSALVVDAKALYDLLVKDELQTALGAEKRTAVEVLVTKQKLREAGATPRWVSSERQLADGLTKESATQLLADRLRTHKNRLTDDLSYEAARKKDPERRQASAQEFALSRPQASASVPAAVYLAVAAAAFVTPADAAESLNEPARLVTAPAFPDWLDLVLVFFTVIVGLVVLRCLWFPCWVPRVSPRIALRDQAVQTSTGHSDDSTQTLTDSEHRSVQTEADAANRSTQTEAVNTEHRSTQTEAAEGRCLLCGATMPLAPMSSSAASHLQVADRRGSLLSSSPQVSVVGGEVLGRSRYPRTQASQASVQTVQGVAQTDISLTPRQATPPVVPPVAPPQDPASDRNVPMPHRVDPNDRAYFTPSGEVWHFMSGCARQRTTSRISSLRPCQFCTTGYSLPRLRHMRDRQGGH